MNLTALWNEIEEEHSWRLDELRFFMNQAATLEDRTEREQFRRAVVLMLYAHFEGFCVFALRHFVRAVNSSGISCRDAQPAIGAATLSVEFAALRDPSSKCDEFRRTLPDDSKLHCLSREREFLERLHSFTGKLVAIPDEVVDSESNLKPIVLRKNLYRLGLPHDLFASIEGNVHDLLKIRNKIAHGELRSGVDDVTFERLRRSAYTIMTTVKREVMGALRREDYKRQA